MQKYKIGRDNNEAPYNHNHNTSTPSPLLSNKSVTSASLESAVVTQQTTELNAGTRAVDHNLQHSK
jgi:hypothetical protein